MTDQNDKKSHTNNRNKKSSWKHKKNSNSNQDTKTKSSTNDSPSKSKARSNKNRRPKALTPARVLQKYDNLLEQHLIARKKFSEVHARVSGKQLEKVKMNLEKTRKALYQYESTLKVDWQKDIIKERLDLYPSDRQFSKTHDLEPIGEEVPFEGEFPDPHLLPTQKESSWAEDKEESTGSFEDYEKYKQLV